MGCGVGGGGLLSAFSVSEHKPVLGLYRWFSHGAEETEGPEGRAPNTDPMLTLNMLKVKVMVMVMMMMTMLVRRSRKSRRRRRGIMVMVPMLMTAMMKMMMNMVTVMLMMTIMQPSRASLPGCEDACSQNLHAGN